MTAPRIKRTGVPLTYEGLGNCLEAALRNAIDSLENAELLLANGRYAAAVFYSHIAVEEIGKCALANLFAMAVEDKQDWTKFDKVSANHAPKVEAAFVQAWINTHVVDHLQGSMSSDIFDSLTDRASFLISAKQRALYSDREPSGQYKASSEVIDEEAARNAVAWARDQLANYQAFRETARAKHEERAT